LRPRGHCRGLRNRCAPHGDVTDPAPVAAFADAGMPFVVGIDVWVNNAGIYPAVPLLEMTDADRQSVVIVNLRGTLLGCREAAKQMVERPARGDPRRDQTDRSGGRITAPFTALVEGRRSQRTDYRHRARR
jgi:NAD(P)-dependent dehydrogenase (short-subunit alcohol dehydrogenase family)